MKHNHKLFIDFAIRVAQESKAIRLKVGAIIAKDGSVIELGYNGTPPGWETNCCEEQLSDFSLKTKPEVIHAEMNALAKCSKLGKPVGGATMYVTHSPCAVCAPVILAAGIKEVIYINDFRSDEGINILRRGGITVTRWES